MWALRRGELHEDTRAAVEAALLGAINHSGDSDSVGTITGNLLGAAHGPGAMPSLFVGQVAWEIVDALAQALLQVRRRAPLETGRVRPT